MSTHRLSPQDFELLSAYADGETLQEENLAAKELISKHAEASAFLRNREALKRRLQTACGHVKAPDHLRLACLQAIESASTTVQTPRTARTPSLYITLAAAAVAIAALLFMMQYARVTPDEPILVQESGYSMETYVHEHYQHDLPELRTASDVSEAQQQIKLLWDIEMTVPELKQASFTGFTYAEFVTGYHTPLLAYTTHDTGEVIVIFAFDMNHLDEYAALHRDEQAVRTCTDPDSVHIKDVAGQHVVSWKWDDTWYAGISQNHGEMLAARLPISN